MINWQETLIQALVALVVYLVGIRGLQYLLRRAIRREWGHIALQVMLFAMITAAFLLFQIPSLQGFALVGIVLAALAATTLAALIQEYASTGDELEEYFGENAKGSLKVLPSNRTLNWRTLNRMAAILRSHGHVQTSKYELTVEVTDYLDSGYWIYNTKDTITYVLSGRTRATLVIEVRPSTLPTSPSFSQSFLSLPLEYHQPSDKWHISYWPRIRPTEPAQWEQLQENIVANAWLSSLDGHNRRQIDFRRDTGQAGIGVGEHAQSLPYPRFIADIMLEPNTPVLSVQIQGLPHPVEARYLYFLAWDLCTESWEFQLLTDKVADKLRVTALQPFTSLTDVAIPILQIRPGFAQLRMQALAESVIIPQDGVIVGCEPLMSPFDSQRHE